MFCSFCNFLRWIICNFDFEWQNMLPGYLIWKRQKKRESAPSCNQIEFELQNLVLIWHLFFGELFKQLLKLEFQNVMQNYKNSALIPRLEVLQFLYEFKALQLLHHLLLILGNKLFSTRRVPRLSGAYFGWQLKMLENFACLICGPTF